MMWSWASILAIVVHEDAEALPQFAKKPPQGGVDYSYLAFTRRVFAIVTAPFWKLGPWHKIPYSAILWVLRYYGAPPFSDKIICFFGLAQLWGLLMYKKYSVHTRVIQQGKKPNGSSRSKHSCWIPTSKTDFSSNPPKKGLCGILGMRKQRWPATKSEHLQPRNRQIWQCPWGPAAGTGRDGPGEAGRRRKRIGQGGFYGGFLWFLGGQWGYPKSSKSWSTIWINWIMT